MSKKGRRVAVRHAELAGRSRRKARQETAPPAPGDGAVVVRSPRPAAAPRPQPVVVQRPAETSPVQRAAVYQYVGQELRRIAVIAAIIFALLASLALVLR